MAKRRESSGFEKKTRDPCDLNTSSLDSFAWSTQSIVSSLLKDRYVQIIVILTFTGFLLRFYNISFNSLWLDEAMTYHFASLPYSELWGSLETGAEFNPPLFYLIESLMLHFGNSEAILRTIPALAGTLLIPVFFLLGKEFKDKNSGIICATLATFSIFLLYYSQEARAYTLALLFASLAILLFFMGLTRNQVSHWVLCGVFSGLALWTHFYTALIPGILLFFGSFFIIFDKEKKKEYMKNLGIFLVSFIVITLPLIIVTFDLFLKRTAVSPTYGLSGIIVLIYAIPALLGGDLLLVGILSILFIIGIIWCLYEERKKGIFLLFGIVTIFLMSYFISFKMPFELRFFYIMIPFLFLGIAYSTRIFCHIFKKRMVVLILIIGIALLHVPLLVTTYTVYTKENWRDFSHEFENYTNDGDVVVLMPAYLHYPFNYYYDPLMDNTTQIGASNIRELEEAVRDYQGKRIYFILTRDISASEPSGASIEWLEQNSRFIGEYTGIYLFQVG
ncbi:MAG: glycosyltransferase family 39 protein [Methanolinea sp.]|jgi:4-amino-4-deoxy-L-arabinose transferase-like glycosyltransferase|nr:glycosyltransferase family 39 protein [Methanolinea sp.]